ncbi:MAG: hypothetical protein ABI315_13575 [Bacteroidia bacterium]
MIELIKKPWDYTFSENNEKYYLSVMCGSIAMFEINIELNANEIAIYKNKGFDFIDEIAKKIQYRPSDYSERNLSNLI